MNMKNKNILAAAVFYIAAVMILAVAGIWGDPGPESMAHALKYFSQNEIETGRSFFLHGLIPSVANKIITIIFITAVIYKEAWGKFSRYLEGRIKWFYIKTFLSFLGLFTVLSVIKIPLNIYGGFYRNRVFEISSIDFSLWLVRYMGGALISIVTISLSLAALLIIVKKTRRFFIYIPAAFFLLSIFFTVLYPRLVTPLFYKTTRIEDPLLIGKIRNITDKAGVRVNDIYVINTSSYATVANAYLVGMGSERRIYLYDTLLSRFSTDEILSVLSHEIAHYREEHMLIGMLLGTLGIFFLFPVFSRASYLIFRKDTGEMADVKNHPELIFLLSMIMFFISPVENSVSRIMERRADRYSIELAGNPEVFIKMEAQLSRVNKSDLLPHPFFSWFYGSHPTVVERIGMAEEYLKK